MQRRSATRPNVFASTLITQRTRIATIFISDFYNPFFAEALVDADRGTPERRPRGDAVSHSARQDSRRDAVRGTEIPPEYIVVMTANRHVPAGDRDGGGRNPPDLLQSLCARHENVLRHLRQSPGRPGTGGFPHSAWAPAHGLCGRNARRHHVDRPRARILRTLRRGRAEGAAGCRGGFVLLRAWPGAARRLLAREPGLDAIFCANDLMAIGTIDGLRHDLGVKVPEQVSVVGFDDVAMAGWPSHSLTTYRHPTQTHGAGDGRTHQGN